MIPEFVEPSLMFSLLLTLLHGFLMFQVITPCRKLILCADNRKEMEDWIAVLKTVQNREHFEVMYKIISALSFKMQHHHHITFVVSAIHFMLLVSEIMIQCSVRSAGIRMCINCLN